MINLLRCRFPPAVRQLNRPKRLYTGPVTLLYWTVCLCQTPNLAVASAAGSAADDADNVEVSSEYDMKYRQLYRLCWHHDRDVRPSAVQLVDLLSYWSSSSSATTT